MLITRGYTFFSKAKFPSIVFNVILISGGIAQLGEHLPCTQGVSGSNPLTSTKGS